LVSEKDDSFENYGSLYYKWDIEKKVLLVYREGFDSFLREERGTVILSDLIPYNLGALGEYNPLENKVMKNTTGNVARDIRSGESQTMNDLFSQPETSETISAANFAQQLSENYNQDGLTWSQQQIVEEQVDFLLDNDGNIRMDRLPEIFLTDNKIDPNKVKREYQKMKKLLGEKTMNQVTKIVENKMNRKKNKSGAIFLAAVALWNIAATSAYAGYKLS
jgi:hypothetical protein